MKKIVIATSNKHKVSEISVKIKPFFGKIFSLDDFPEIGEIIEDGNTVEENSFKKSMAAYNHTKIASIADDTILEVDALDGDPGLFTARYAGENASYEDNMSKLLTELNDVEDKFRTARFKTVITFVDGINDFCVKGKIEGKILNERIGNKGFGYDPIFLSKEFNISLAEMDNNLKNKVSHRGIAIDKLINKIKTIKK